MSRTNVAYILYDKGVEVLKGNKYDINTKCGMTLSSVRYYAHSGRTYKKRYKVVSTKSCIKGESMNQPTKERLDFYIRHLERYGNVASRVNPDKYLPYLEERGYKCTVIKYVEREYDYVDVKMNLVQKGRKKSVGYVIELIN